MSLSPNILTLVYDYTFNKEMKLRPEIDESKINIGVLSNHNAHTFVRDRLHTFEEDELYRLSSNPSMIPLLLENPHLIDWKMLSGNPNGIYLIERNPEKMYLLNRAKLSYNPCAIPFLERHPELIDWRELSGNPSAISLLERNQDKIDWINISNNPAFNLQVMERNGWDINKLWSYGLSDNPSCISLLEKYPQAISWSHLSSNPEAIDILRKNRDKIVWSCLCENPSAYSFLSENMDKIVWYILILNRDERVISLLRENLHELDWMDFITISNNPAAIEIILTRLGDIDWSRLSTNPAIFIEDNERTRKTRKSWINMI